MRSYNMYKLTINPFTNIIDKVQRLSDGAFIPFDKANTDYQEYLEWVAKGNKAMEADEKLSERLDKLEARNK